MIAASLTAPRPAAAQMACAGALPVSAWLGRFARGT
jgi:hypothetical protein